MRVLTIAGGPVNELVFAPDGRRLAVAVDGRGVYVADLADGVFRVVPPAEAPKPYNGLAFHHSGRVSWLADRGRREGDPTGRTADPLPGLKRHQVDNQVVVGPGGRLVAVTTNPFARYRPDRSGQRLRTWLPTPAGGWAESWSVASDAVSFGSSLAGTRGGRFFTTETPAGGPSDATDNDMVCRSEVDGAVLDRAPNPVGWIETMLAAAEDGSAVVVHGGFKLALWRAGEPPRLLEDVPRILKAAAFHPSGAYFVTAHYSRGTNPVRLFDAESGQVVRTYDWGVGLWGLAFTPDGQLGAAGTDDGRVVLWDCD